MRRIGLALTAMGLALGGAAPAPQGDENAWLEVLGPDGQRVGIQRESVTVHANGSSKATMRDMAYQVDGHGRIWLHSDMLREYDGAGQLKGFGFSQRVGKRVIEVFGIVGNGTIKLIRQADGKSVTVEQSWPKGADLADPLAIAQQAGPRLELAAGSLKIEPRELRLVPQSDGRVLRLTYAETRLDNADLARAGGTGRIDEVELPQIGHSLMIRRANGPLPPAKSAITPRLPHEGWPSLFYLPTGALKGHIRYNFAFRQGFSADLPQTGEQRVMADAEGPVLDICPQCGPGLSSDPAQLAEWARPTPWIESGRAEFAAAVRPVLRAKASPHATMDALAKLARERLTHTDFTGYFSAGQAWRLRSGDCTEDALVLAALARAAGIPARVASGLVYTRSRYHGVEDAFLPHAWVLAYVEGRWRSYDISLDGYDASHIALALSDGEPAAYREAGRLAALIELKSMREVRKRN